MTRIRKRFRIPGMLLAVVCAGAVWMDPGCAWGAGPDPYPLSMEELEVRGFREKPDRLYLPVPKQRFSFTPVLYDFFTEDLVRPIYPWEMAVEETADEGAAGKPK